MSDAKYNLPNLDQLSDKASSIYMSLGEEFISSNEGKFIAIEIESGDYFLGETREEAVAKAKQKYPSKIIFIRRIGVVEKLQQHSAPFNYSGGYSHACVF